MRLRRAGHYLSERTVISFQYLQRSTPSCLPKLLPAFPLPHAYSISGWGQSYGCTHRNSVLGLFCLMSMDRGQVRKSRPRVSLLALPRGGCLWTPTHRDFGPWDHPSSPSTVCLVILSFPAGLPPILPTPQSLREAHSTLLLGAEANEVVAAIQECRLCLCVCRGRDCLPG